MKKTIGLILLAIILLSMPSFASQNDKQESLEFREGMILYQKGDYDNAGKKLLEEIKKNPNNKLACLHLGAIYLTKKDYQNAAKYYDETNTGVHTKYYIGPYYFSAYCYHQMKDYDKAISRLTKYLAYGNQTKDKDTLADGYNLLGDCYMKKRYYHLATANFKKALKTKRNHFFANKNLGLLYYKLDNNKKAQYYLEIALKEKRDAECLKTLGFLYAKKQDAETAKKCLLESVSINSDDYEGQVGLILANLYYNEKILKEPQKIELNITEKAPTNLHKLIKAESFVSPKKFAKLHEIIDLIWNDEEGKKLLKIVNDNNIPIVLCSNVTHSSITVPNYNITYSDGDETQYVMVSELTENNKFKITIGEKNITEDDNKTLFESIALAVNPICHMAYRQTYYLRESSKEENFLCNLISSNIANKIINKKALSKNESLNEALLFTAKGTLNNTNKTSCDPIFIKKINKLNINLPHYELYSNFYTTVETDITINDYLYSAAAIFKKNQAKTIYKEHLCTKLIFCLDKNGNISNIEILNSSGSKQYDKECTEALEKSSPLPQPVPIKGDFAFRPVIFINGN